MKSDVLNPQYKLYSSLPQVENNKTYAEINTLALVDNYKALCQRTTQLSGKPCRPICVLKADAYGHGADACALSLADAGCDFFAVSSVAEAIALRNCVKNENIDILILGYTCPQDAALLAQYDIIQTVFSADYAGKLSVQALNSNCKIRIHIKLDTGMNRLGFPVKNQCEINQAIIEIENIYINPAFICEGIFTHFAIADEDCSSYENEPTQLQYACYTKTLVELEKRGLTFKCRHVSNSAAAARFGDFSFDAVRFGIMLYGGSNSPLINLPLQPVMKLCSVISHIHTMNKGESCGYGLTYYPDKICKIATIPIGYADGFARAYKGANVIVHGSSGEKFEAPIVGRICMDQLMLDVTDIQCNVCDKVVFFGDNNEQLSRLAQLANTIDYEILCLISSRVPRIIIK